MCYTPCDETGQYACGPFLVPHGYTRWLSRAAVEISGSPQPHGTVETRYNDTNFSAIFLRYTEVSFNQGSRAGIINKEGPP
jgi:hypothetical protein